MTMVCDTGKTWHHDSVKVWNRQASIQRTMLSNVGFNFKTGHKAMGWTVVGVP